MTPTIEIGDTIADGTFTYVPYTPELDSHVSLSFIDNRQSYLLSYLITYI